MNTNGKATWWIIGLLTTVVLGASSGWVGSIYSQVRQHGERLAVLEAQVHDTRDQLQHINRKLDQLLETHFRRSP
jgi:hypothetical protein